MNCSVVCYNFSIMGQITIEIPQSVERKFRIISEISAKEVLTNLEILVKSENKDEQDLGLVDENLEEIRTARMNWLKENREKYAGQYVALNGGNLVGLGKTIREAHEKAKENGVEKPFLVRVSSENEILSGGW